MYIIYRKAHTYHYIVTNFFGIIEIDIANFRNVKFTGYNDVETQAERKQKEYWFDCYVPKNAENN